MRYVKDIYKPATRPGTQRKGKPERLTGDHPERTKFCLACPHPGEPCNGKCAEYRQKFGRGGE